MRGVVRASDFSQPGTAAGPSLSVHPCCDPLVKRRSRAFPACGRLRSCHDLFVTGRCGTVRHAQPCCARGLYRDDFHERAAAVLGTAAVHENGAAAARRLARGVVGGDGILPVAAARRLCLCACADDVEEPAGAGRDSPCLAGDGVCIPAAVHRKRLGRAARQWLCVLATRPVRSLERLAVLRARRQQPDAAGLVRAHRPPAGAGPLLPLCVLEHRQFFGAVVLSGAAGADADAAHAEPAVDRGLWPADPVDRGLRVFAAARAAMAIALNESNETALPPSWLQWGRWVFLAAVPSGLLIAVTAHISTDVAAAPLLWVLPLSLYLLTWVMVFQSRPLLPHAWMLKLQP